MPTLDLPTEIARHGASVGATRVVFRAGGELVKTPLDEVGIRATLEDRVPEKYKLQDQPDGRWRDLTGYVAIATSRDLVRAIAGIDLDAIEASDADEIRAVADSRKSRFLGALREMCRRVTLVPRPLDSPLPGRAAQLAVLLHDAVQSEHTAYVAAYMDLTAALAHVDPEDILTGDRVDSALDIIESRVDDHPDLFSAPAAQVAVSMHRAKILSCRFRSEAAEQFSSAISRDSSGVIRDLYIDTGAATYFDAPNLGPEDESLVAQIIASVASASAPAPGNPLAVAVSVDPNYLRIYAPVLMHYAQQMPDVDFVVLVCGTGPDAGAAIEDAEHLRGSLARVARTSRPANVRFLQVPVPNEVAEARTFYACARFFALDRLLDEYASVYVMDVDLTTDDDPRPFFRAVAGVPFGVPVNQGLQALSPWRRYLAGNLAVNRDSQDREIVRDLQTYLAHGLRKVDSWMLDQNALAYAIERNPAEYTVLNGYRRPFNQPPFRSVWEANMIAAVASDRGE